MTVWNTARRSSPSKKKSEPQYQESPTEAKQKMTTSPTDHSKDENTWSNTWQTIAEESKGGLINFRCNKKLAERLDGGIGKKAWGKFCSDTEISVEYFADSLIGNPKVGKLKGSKVTMNSLRHAYYIHRIKSRLVTSNKPLKVLDVGAGYGGFVEQFCRQFDVEAIYLLDAPIMQKLQKYYLTEAGYDDKLYFEEPKAMSIDLIISTNSLGEMPQEDVSKYIKLFESVLKPDTGLLYLVQRTKKGFHILTAWDDYPFDNKWQLITEEFPPMPTFTECYGTRKGI